jgi:hypothetical protein
MLGIVMVSIIRMVAVPCDIPKAQDPVDPAPRAAIPPMAVMPCVPLRVLDLVDLVPRALCVQPRIQDLVDLVSRAFIHIMVAPRGSKMQPSLQWAQCSPRCPCISCQN